MTQGVGGRKSASTSARRKSNRRGRLSNGLVGMGAIAPSRMSLYSVVRLMPSALAASIAVITSSPVMCSDPSLRAPVAPIIPD